MAITSIKFPVRFWDFCLKQDVTLGAEFKLGPGPCGKVVTQLAVAKGSGPFLQILQFHSDDTHKAFLYRREDLRGRIEIEYAPCS